MILTLKVMPRASQKPTQSALISQIFSLYVMIINHSLYSKYIPHSQGVGGGGVKGKRGVKALIGKQEAQCGGIVRNAQCHQVDSHVASNAWHN